MEISKSLEEAITFFTNKFNVEYGGQSKEENHEDWMNCLKYVGKYGLYYEVFEVAHQNLPKNATFEQCSRAIGEQMDEWDL